MTLAAVKLALEDQTAKVVYGWIKSKAIDPQTGNEVPTLQPDKPLNIVGMANAAISDRVDEMLDPRGCLSANFMKNPIFLCDHNYNKPIGTVISLDIQDDGVHFAAEIGRPDLAPLTEDQLEKRSLIAQGILKTVSVGFIPLEMQPAEFDDAGKLIKPAFYTQWELLEISVVSVPCNAESIFQMKEFHMASGSQRAPMTPPVKTAPPPSPAPAAGHGEPDADEPVHGSAAEYLKAIHEGVGAIKEYMAKGADHMTSLHSKVDGLHQKMDSMKAAAGGQEPDEDDKDVTQNPSGTEGTPEPIKAVSDRVKSLEENLEKLAKGIGKLSETLAKTMVGKL